VISQVPTAQQLIPASISSDADDETEDDTNYEYEPDEEAILADLLPRNISVQVFRAILENSASEQGARMSAMDNATRNAGEMIDKLTLSFNRQRQAQITKELIEIKKQQLQQKRHRLKKPLLKKQHQKVVQVKSLRLLARLLTFNLKAVCLQF